MRRDIFSELIEGLEALADERHGKITLPTRTLPRAIERQPSTPTELKTVGTCATKQPG